MYFQKHRCVASLLLRSLNQHYKGHRRTVQAVGTVGLRLGPPAAPAAVLDERPLADPARGVERPLLEDDLALLPVKVLTLLDLDLGVLCVVMKPVRMTIS